MTTSDLTILVPIFILVVVVVFCAIDEKINNL